MSSIADEKAFNAAAEEAIGRVLAAERDARAAVEQARLEVERIAEAARLADRALAERTERRVRAAVAAFERELAGRLAEIDAAAARLTTPHVLSDSELAALHAAVGVLARELVGADS